MISREHKIESVDIDTTDRVKKEGDNEDRSTSVLQSLR